jgi:hypothetical protein
MRAARDEHIHVIRFLLERGVSVNAVVDVSSNVPHCEPSSQLEVIDVHAGSNGADDSGLC